MTTGSPGSIRLGKYKRWWLRTRTFLLSAVRLFAVRRHPRRKEKTPRNHGPVDEGFREWIGNISTGECASRPRLRPTLFAPLGMTRLPHPAEHGVLPSNTCVNLPRMLMPILAGSMATKPVLQQSWIVPFNHVVLRRRLALSNKQFGWSIIQLCPQWARRLRTCGGNTASRVMPSFSQVN